MQTIYKYPFKTTDLITIEMPRGATILTVQTQNEVPCIWALIDTDAFKEKRHFAIYGTGHTIRPGVKTYIGTYQLMSGSLVFHLFEIELLDK